jgi:hypothetical protein
MTDNARQVMFEKRQLAVLNIALVLEFILGITLTWLVDFVPGKHGSMQASFLIAHIVIAVGLLIGGLARFVTSLRWHRLQLYSGVGLLCVIGAFASGSSAARDDSGTAVFLMNVFFLAALAAYTYSLSVVRRG